MDTKKQMEEFLDTQAAEIAEQGGPAPSCGHDKCGEAAERLEKESEKALEMIFGDAGLSPVERMLVLSGFIDVIEAFDEMAEKEHVPELMGKVLANAMSKCGDTIINQHYRTKYENL